MTNEDLHTKDLFHTNTFQNKIIWAIAKMLHTMKDAMRFTEDNIDTAIESKGESFSTSHKKKKKEKFRKELSKRKKFISIVVCVLRRW